MGPTENKIFQHISQREKLSGYEVRHYKTGRTEIVNKHLISKSSGYG